MATIETVITYPCLSIIFSLPHKIPTTNLAHSPSDTISFPGPCGASAGSVGVRAGSVGVAAGAGGVAAGAGGLASTAGVMVGSGGAKSLLGTIPTGSGAVGHIPE